MQVQLFINGAVKQTHAYVNVDCMFLVSASGVTHAVRYDSNDLYDFADCGRSLDIHGKTMRISNQDVSRDAAMCRAIHEVCKQAFEDYFSAYNFTADDGWSIRSCMQLAEDSMSPRAESIINNKYVSVFCDENAVDANVYLVSVTPYNETPDAFDYDVVENVPFTTSGWFATYEEAMQAYKTACIECIQA